MNKQPPIAIVLSVLRAILCFLFVFLSSLISHFFIYYQVFDSMMENGNIAPILIHSYSAIVFLVALCLYTRAFALHHKPFRKECAICSRKNSMTFWQKLITLFKTPAFLLHFAINAALTLLIPYATVGKHLSFVFFPTTHGYDTMLLMTAITLPLTLVLVIASFLWAARSVRNEGGRERQKRNEKPVAHLIAEVFNLLLAIVCASILIPIIIVAASQFLIFLIFFPAIIGIFLAIWVLRYVRAMRIRSKFLHSLKEACRKNRYSISKIKKPYRSLFFITDGISFTVKKPDGKQYDCKLLHSIKRTSPMIFHSDGFATLITPICFFRAVLAHRVKTLPYAFESDNPKCVIVCPIPRAFYAQNESSQSGVDTTLTESKFVMAGLGGPMSKGGLHEVGLSQNTRSRELDIGDYFNGYKFYNATGFLNAIQHDVLDR